jgi:hypothetical protein
VSGHPLPPNKFREDQDVTTVIRVGKVWLTVLGKGPAIEPSTSVPNAGEGTVWNTVREVSEITGDAPNQTSAS